MKIRMGFVSNSSSSSFLVYGACLSPRNELYDLTSKIEVYSPPDDNTYIGLSWDRVGDDETGKQFKERVTKKVTALLSEAGVSTDGLKFRTFSAAWRS